MDPSIQLASPARQPKIEPAHQSPQPNRGQPVDAPHLERKHGLIDRARSSLDGWRDAVHAHARSDMNRLLARVPGVGKLIASVITASTPDPSGFRSGRDFAAWLGLTPRQNSSGGKQTLGGISKQGNRYIRKLLVLSAT